MDNTRKMKSIIKWGLMGESMILQILRISKCDDYPVTLNLIDFNYHCFSSSI